MKYRIFYRVWKTDVVIGMQRMEPMEFEDFDDTEARKVLSNLESAMRSNVNQAAIAGFFIDKMICTDHADRIVYENPLYAELRNFQQVANRP